MRKNKVILYGHFGSGNIGNDSSFEAALYHVKKYQPDANIFCICNGAKAIAARFDISTLPMSGAHADKQYTSQIKRLFLRLMDEIRFWRERPSWFNVGDKFVVVGTGAVDDMAVRRPWHSPYELYKWCKIAKKGGAKVIFLSVGVGPLLNRFSRILMLKALRMADYRSYRETGALDYLESVGFDATGDLIYPDLVFSLPITDIDFAKISQPIKTIGLGLINYYGWRHDQAKGESIYQEYLSKIKKFVLWLLNKGFAIRLLFGDSTDQRPVNELVEFVSSQANPEPSQKLVVETISTVDDLLRQIVQTDLIVASRFHNVLCSLMLERPVISLGYHRKNVDLMNDMGLREYCLNIDDFTVDELIQQFSTYAANPVQVLESVRHRMSQYHRLLDKQYQEIFQPASHESLAR